MKRGRGASALAAAAAVIALAGGCSPQAEERLLPPGVVEQLPARRMNVVWAPEMTPCNVCNASVAEGVGRFAVDYPEAGVLTALAAGAPFPQDLVVGTTLLVTETGNGSASPERPYIAILDAAGRLLAWRRIPEFGPQDELVYQELVGAYSLTAPLE